jgi:hypothetical protein
LSEADYLARKMETLIVEKQVCSQFDIETSSEKSARGAIEFCTQTDNGLLVCKEQERYFIVLPVHCSRHENIITLVNIFSVLAAILCW